MIVVCLVICSLLVNLVTSTSSIDINSIYCCHYADTQAAVCSVGGCQRSALAAFRVVDDCAQCTKNNTTSQAGSNTTTTCTFCGSPQQPCVNVTSDAFQCAPPNASFPHLHSFIAASSTMAARPLCCWWGAADDNSTKLTVDSAVDSCHSTDQSVPLVVGFVEHLFDFDCPARPPCENDCNGHGHCAVSQCVCEKSYFGESCSVRCDKRTCAMGHCYAMRGSDQLCHCHPNVVGERCDRCATGFSGVDCMSTAVGGSTSANGPTSATAPSSSGDGTTARRTDDESSLSSGTSATLSTTTTEMVRDRARTRRCWTRSRSSRCRLAAP
jgi:hypothetical protein